MKQEYTVTRKLYKEVKKYDHGQFNAFCKKIYDEGYSDAIKDIQKESQTETEDNEKWKKKSRFSFLSLV